MRYIRTTLVTAGAVAGAAAALLLISLMLPVKVWRTGELPTVPLAVEPARADWPTPARLWIDTDAACGQGPRTDPDDCLALLLLAQEERIEVIGASTVFGNAPLGDTDRTTRAPSPSQRGDP